MNAKDIINILPYSKPFHFVDDLQHIDENGTVGTFTFNPDLDFYKGHFKNNPVTPGVILTEVMGQIGLVAFGICLMYESGQSIEKIQIALTSTAIDFFKPVFPGEKVIVKSKKEYFRFNKLKCKVEMLNSKNELVCRGEIAGMLAKKST